MRSNAVVHEVSMRGKLDGVLGLKYLPSIVSGSGSRVCFYLYSTNSFTSIRYSREVKAVSSLRALYLICGG